MPPALTRVVAARNGMAADAREPADGPRVPALPARLAHAHRVRLKDLAVFTRQLAALVNSGLTIPASLSLLAARTSPPRFARVIRKIRADVQTGVPLSSALRAHPRIFDGLYINMVRAGEVGGVLDEILLRLSGFLEKELALQQKIKGALVYPVAIAGVAAAIVAFIVFSVLPRFIEMFAQLGLPLPPMTRLIVGTAVAARQWWPLLPLGAFAVWWAYRSYVRTAGGRARIDGLKLALPLFGPINRTVMMGRFARTLGRLVQSGVPILTALDVMIRAVDNVVVARALASVRSSIREGASIAAPLAATGVFSAIVIQMVAVGERTGALDGMLEKAADFCDSEVEYAVNGLMSLLEPALILTVGGMVAFIVIAFYLPLFNLVGGIR